MAFGGDAVRVSAGNSAQRYDLGAGAAPAEHSGFERPSYKSGLTAQIWWKHFTNMVNSALLPYEKGDELFSRVASGCFDASLSCSQSGQFSTTFELHAISVLFD